MKVMAINGSPRREGNTAQVLSAMSGILKDEGIDTEIAHVGSERLRGCVACGVCRESEDCLCAFGDDILNETALKMRAADGFILGAPTYYGGIPGTMKCFLDRAFYANNRYFRFKAATVIAVVRRAGGVDVVSQLMNFLKLSEMAIPPSQYWTVVYGRTPGEVRQDAEGMQTISRNARSLAWLLKTLETARPAIQPPSPEDRIYTHFVR